MIQFLNTQILSKDVSDLCMNHLKLTEDKNDLSYVLKINILLSRITIDGSSVSN